MDVPNEPLRRRAHTVSDMRHLENTSSTPAIDSTYRRRESETISNSLPLQSLFSYFYRSSAAASLYSSVESELSVLSSEEGEEDIKHRGSDNRKLEVNNNIMPAHEVVSKFTIKETDKLNKDSVKLPENSDTTKNSAVFSKSILPTAIYEMFLSQKLPCIQDDQVDKDNHIQHSQNMYNMCDKTAKPKSNRVKVNRRDLNSMAPISL